MIGLDLFKNTFPDLWRYIRSNIESGTCGFGIHETIVYVARSEDAKKSTPADVRDALTDHDRRWITDRDCDYRNCSATC